MTETPSPKNNPSSTKADQSPYAGVMKRGIASFIDVILLMIPYMLYLFYFSPIPLSLINNPEHRLEYLEFTQSIPVVLSAQILSFFYFSFQYCSKYQATLGMRLVDIKLTTENSNKPSWPSLSLRYFLYILPTLILIFLNRNNMIPVEYQEASMWLSALTIIIIILMIALTKRKQTYYDMAAKTLVLQQPKEINPPFIYAGLGRRFFSYLADLIIILFLLGVAIYGLGVIDPPKDSPSIFDLVLRPSIFLIALILPLAYSLLQYRSKYQATLGMRLLSIKIMTTDYQKPSIKQLLLRYFIDFITSLLPFINFIATAMILCTDRKQAHYDKMSKTIFVKTSK